MVSFFVTRFPWFPIIGFMEVPCWQTTALLRFHSFFWNLANLWLDPEFHAPEFSETVQFIDAFSSNLHVRWWWPLCHGEDANRMSKHWMTDTRRWHRLTCRIESFVEMVYDERAGRQWQEVDWDKVGKGKGSRWQLCGKAADEERLLRLPPARRALHPVPSPACVSIQHHSLLSLSLQCLALVVTLHPERMRSKAFFTLPSLGSVIQSSFFIFRSVMCRLFSYAVCRPDVTVLVDGA